MRLRILIDFDGSPPQVRGKPFAQLYIKLRLRITPAGAGKTGTTIGTEVANGDHPRRCGENRKQEQ